MSRHTLAFAATALLLAAGAARAELPFSHPAVAMRAEPVIAALQARDASPVLIGHPASPRWTVVHANHEHPAVTQARLAGTTGVDANTFLVQPPAHVQWTLASERDVAVAQR